MTDSTPLPKMPIFPEPNTQCTNELRQYLDRQFTIFDFLSFNSYLADRADKVSETAIKALAFGGTEKDINRLQQFKQNPKPNFNKLRTFGEFQSENTCIRSVDNFLTYLSKTIQLSMAAKPEMLRSSESIKIEDILRFDNMKDLTSFLIDRKVNELSYAGLREISRFLKERININFLSDPSEDSLISISIELRNIYTHNRGIVNNLFLKRISGISHNYEFVLGQRFHVDYDMAISISDALTAAAVRVDGQVAEKFGLSRMEWRSNQNANAT